MWPGSFPAAVSPIRGYFFLRPRGYSFLVLEKFRPVSLQFVSEELYCQVSEAFTEFHPEGLKRGGQYEEGRGKQFLGRVDEYKERKK
jgi:hypothetical protein